MTILIEVNEGGGLMEEAIELGEIVKRLNTMKIVASVRVQIDGTKASLAAFEADKIHRR